MRIERDGVGYRLAVENDDVDAERFARLVVEARGLEPSQSLARVDRRSHSGAGEPYGEFVDLDFAQSESTAAAGARAAGARAALVGAASSSDDTATLFPIWSGSSSSIRCGSRSRGSSCSRCTEAAVTPTRSPRTGGSSSGSRSSGSSPRRNRGGSSGRCCSARPSWRWSSRHRTNIGARLTSFVGREDDRRVVRDALREHRLVTLTGPGRRGQDEPCGRGGARAPSDEHSDGAWLVELAPIRDPARVAEAVAEAVGLRSSEFDGQSGVDAQLPSEPPAAARACCSSSTTASTSRLPSASSRSRSSRRVPAFGCSRRAASRSAFRASPSSRCAARLRPDLAGRRSTPCVSSSSGREPCAATSSWTRRRSRAIAEVCERLDGLPLALELAAARLRTLSPREIAERLADRFALLGRGPEMLAERQRTLAGVVGWSYQLLSEPEQTLFRRLSVFPSSFGLEAAEEVCSGDGLDAPLVADLLASLVDRSMVVASGAGADRFRLLETLARVRPRRSRGSRGAARRREAARRVGDADRGGGPRARLERRPRGRDAIVRAEARRLRSRRRSRVRAARRGSRPGPHLRARHAGLPLRGWRPTIACASRRRSRFREARSSAGCAACARSPCC